MAPAADPFWQAAGDHVAALGVAADGVLAPAGFAALLPRCRGPGNPPADSDLAALILHKGRLEEVPLAILTAALDHLAVTFANEVFLVLTRIGERLAPDHPHLMPRESLLAAAHNAHANRRATALVMQGNRMPATYMGQGRVLLETAFGHLMLASGSDTAIVPHLIRDGWFDRNFTDVIAGLLEPGMTFIDIGANFGTYTLIGAQVVGDTGRVIAIEPAPAIAALLRENVTMNGFAGPCAVVPCAVGAEAGRATLYQFATRQGSNTLLPGVAENAKAHYGESITAQEVECRTLDSIVAELAPARVDLVKIDVEGFEHQVLEGARQTLARHRPTLVLEWHSAFFAGRTDDALALHDLLTEQLGYGLHRIEPGATTRALTLEELMQYGHSDLVAKPAPQEET